MDDNDQFEQAERAGFNPYDHVPRSTVSITDAEIHAWLDGEGGDTHG